MRHCSIAFWAFAPSSARPAISAASWPRSRPVGHRALGVGQDLDERAAARRACRTTRGRTRACRDARARPCAGARSTAPPPRACSASPVHHGDLQDDADLLALTHAASGELPFVERDEVVPHLVVGEVIDEGARGLGMARREIEHALVDRVRPRLVGELLLEDARKTDRVPRSSRPSRSTPSRTARAPRRGPPSAARRGGCAPGGAPRGGSSGRA